MFSLKKQVMWPKGKNTSVSAGEVRNLSAKEKRAPHSVIPERCASQVAKKGKSTGPQLEKYQRFPGRGTRELTFLYLANQQRI